MWSNFRRSCWPKNYLSVFICMVWLLQLFFGKYMWWHNRENNVLSSSMAHWIVHFHLQTTSVKASPWLSLKRLFFSRRKACSSKRLSFQNHFNRWKFAFHCFRYFCTRINFWLLFDQTFANLFTGSYGSFQSPFFPKIMKKLNKNT